MPYRGLHPDPGIPEAFAAGEQLAETQPDADRDTRLNAAEALVPQFPETNPQVIRGAFHIGFEATRIRQRDRA